MQIKFYRKDLLEEKSFFETTENLQIEKTINN